MLRNKEDKRKGIKEKTKETTILERKKNDGIIRITYENSKTREIKNKIKEVVGDNILIVEKIRRNKRMEGIIRDMGKRINKENKTHTNKIKRQGEEERKRRKNKKATNNRTTRNNKNK